MANHSPQLQDVDFNLHGVVGIRVLNASATDVATVQRQLGPVQGSLERAPDIVIRFVDRLPEPKRLRLLGLDEAGFTEDAFWILRSKHKASARVVIPVEAIGEGCEIVCERGLPAVPLLVAIINLTALGRGVLPLHASAFTYRGIGGLSTGWSKGGKTEALLAFMAHGANYIADEWTYLHPDGQMSGIPEPIRVWDWHLDSLPHYLRRTKRSERVKLRSIHGVQRLLACAPRIGPLGKVKRRVMPLLKRQSFLDLEPARLFGSDAISMRGRCDQVLFVASHADPEIRVEPADGSEIARRMVHSLQFEQSPFMAFYRMFRFAFPERANDLIDRTEALQAELLHRYLGGKEAYTILHPYPCSLEKLFSAIVPLFATRRAVDLASDRVVKELQTVSAGEAR